MLEFNSTRPLIMYVDMNSCFASVEQQANPLLRGRPVVVVTFLTNNGFILAASVEAKKVGIKMGMKLGVARSVCPELVAVSPDPEKYRFVHKRLKRILRRHCSRVEPRSIDEFALDYNDWGENWVGDMKLEAKKIKEEIKSELGSSIRVSIGISVNRFLAKTASNLKKPDGLELIDRNNFFEVYEKVALIDICGISWRTVPKLIRVGINTTADLYRADLDKLRAVFGKTVAYYWYARLRGWEIDDVTFKRKSFGNSFSLPKKLGTRVELMPLICKLLEKTVYRMNKAGFEARGVSLVIVGDKGGGFRKGVSWATASGSSLVILKRVEKIMDDYYRGGLVRFLSVSCFSLVRKNEEEELFERYRRGRRLSEAIGRVKRKWGVFSLVPAVMLPAKKMIADSIGFGGVREIS